MKPVVNAEHFLQLLQDREPLIVCNIEHTNLIDI